jgi:hypothetical protein
MEMSGRIEPPVTIRWEAEWAAEPLWKLWRRKSKFISIADIKSKCSDGRRHQRFFV